MRTLLCLLPLLCLALAAPANLSDRQKLILKVWGPDTDLIRAKLILEEEGKKVGLTGAEYFDGCTVDAVESGLMSVTAEEQVDLANDMAEAKKIAATIKFESKEDVFKVWEERFPKSYAIFSKRFDFMKKVIAKLDPESQKFANEVGDTLLDALIMASKSSSNPLENPMKELTQMAKQFKKIITSYTALPQSSKDALEKTFCSRASIRIAGAEQQFAMFIGMMNAMADLDDLQVSMKKELN